ncbi:RICIN domain-containing protein [Aquimarina sp. RZ0]|nr:RICIN domain-containing protein [Aquimarina sp. RZ0]
MKTKRKLNSILKITFMVIATFFIQSCSTDTVEESPEIEEITETLAESIERIDPVEFNKAANWRPAQPQHGKKYLIENYQGLYLGTSDDNFKNGINIKKVMLPGNYKESTWKMWDYGDRTIIKLASNDKYCVDVERYATGNGGNIHLWTYNAQGNQQFLFERYRNENIFRIKNFNSKKYLAVSQHGNVIQWQFTDSRDQLWRLHKQN